MNNSNYRNAEPCDKKNVKNANVVQNGQCGLRKCVKNKTCPLSKVLFATDKMAKAEDHLLIVLSRILQVECEYSLDNSLSISINNILQLLR